MNIKKIIFGVISCGMLFSTFSYILPNLVEINSKADTSLQNSGKGEIVVQYVDQDGNVIRPATTVMGKTGSTYVASIPKIPGYTYSSIENGQNNSNGPQMIFGGDDPATDIMEMSIVYKSTGNSSNNNSSDSNSTNGNKGTAISPSKSGNSNNSSSNNTNKNSDTSKSSGTTKKSNSATKNKTGSNNKNTSENNGNNSDDKVNKSTKTNDKKSDKSDKNKVDDDNKKDNSIKNKDKKKSHKSIISWVISGIILVVVAGVAFAWHKFRKPRHFGH